MPRPTKRQIIDRARIVGHLRKEFERIVNESFYEFCDHDDERDVDAATFNDAVHKVAGELKESYAPALSQR